MNLLDYSEEQRITLLMYGESGAGKSIRAASTAGLWGPTYIFDFDRKIGGVYEFYKKQPEILKNIEYDTYTNSDDAFAKMQSIDKIIHDTGKSPYATVILDSWTAWEESVIQKIIADNPGKDRKKMYMDAAKKMPIAVPTLEDFGIHSSVQSRFILELVSLPINVIVTAHIQSKKDEITGGKEVGIQAVGKLWKTLPKFFNEVHRCFIDRGEYRAQVRGDSLYFCNTRLQEIPKDGIIKSDMSLLTPMAHIEKSAS